MRVLGLYMTTGRDHIIYVPSTLVWAVMPRGEGSRVYLRSVMDNTVRPSLVHTEVDPKQGVTSLVSAAVMEGIGSIVDATASVNEVAAACGLPVFGMRIQPEGLRCAIAPDAVVSIAPALGQSTEPVGTNIFVSGLLIETDSRMVQVHDLIDQVRESIGWDGRVQLVGRPHAAEQSVLTTPVKH